MNKKFELLTKGTKVKIVDVFKCKYCSADFPLYDLEKEILDKEGFLYPDFCPTCRFRMLYSYINDKHLYNRKDDLTGKNVISILTPDFLGKVFKAEEYKKMLLDDYGLKFAREIGENIFEDFKDLYKDFPKPSKLVYPELENSEYASHCGRGKNIYMSFCVFISSENIYNSFTINNSKNIFDSYNIYSSQNIYNSGLINSSFDISYSYNVFNSSTLLFCRNMQSCNDCLFCCNQVNSKYKIFNKQFSQEDYHKAKKDIYEKIGNYEEFKKLEKVFEDFLEKNLIEPSSILMNTDLVTGEKTSNSKNSVNVYTSENLENSVNIIASWGGNYLVNSVEAGIDSQYIVGSCSVGISVFGVSFSFACVNNCKNVYYSIDIESCEECLFCVGLKNKKYCILNKTYEKEEYFKLKGKVIKQLKDTGKWGEFLGFDISPFPYNDTLAYDFFKVNKVINFDLTETIIDENGVGVVKVFEDKFVSEAELDLGGTEKIKIKWRTKDKEVNVPENMKTLTINELNTFEIDVKSGKAKLDEILDKAIICPETKRPFRVIKAEIEYIKKKGFPIPRLHPEFRMNKLLLLRKIGELHLGTSSISGEDVLTVFKGKTRFKVYSPEEYKDFMFK